MMISVPGLELQGSLKAKFVESPTVITTVRTFRKMTQYPQAIEVASSPVLSILSGTTQLSDVELLVGREDRNFSHNAHIYNEKILKSVDLQDW
jgi:hypothetical protein